MSLSILHLGESSAGSTSRQCAEALRRLGHRVTIVSQRDFFPSLGRLANKLSYWTGHRIRQPAIARKLKSLIPGGGYDVAWVDAGWWCGAPVAQLLKSVAKRVVLLNLDDPTGPREPHHWKSLLGALPWFDLCAVVRWETANEFHELGARASRAFGAATTRLRTPPNAPRKSRPTSSRARFASSARTWKIGTS